VAALPPAREEIADGTGYFTAVVSYELDARHAEV